MKTNPAEAMRYFLAENGEAVGPFTVDQLRAMFASGRVHAGSQVCPEGWNDWSPVERFQILQAKSSVLRVEPSRATVLLVVFVVVGLLAFFAILRVNEGVKEAARASREATRLMR